MIVEDLCNTYFAKPYEYKEFVEKVNKSISRSYSKKRKLTRTDFDYLTKIIESLNQSYKERLNRDKIKQEKTKQEKINQERIIQAYKEHLNQEKIKQGEKLPETTQEVKPHETIREASQENQEEMNREGVEATALIN